MFKGFKAAQSRYENAMPDDDDECGHCVDGECNTHDYYRTIFLEKRTIHTANKDHMYKGKLQVKKGNKYKATMIKGYEISKGVRSAIYEYKKFDLGSK
jgi:hypothetical protein